MRKYFSIFIFGLLIVGTIQCLINLIFVLINRTEWVRPIDSFPQSKSDEITSLAVIFVIGILFCIFVYWYIFKRGNRA